MVQLTENLVISRAKADSLTAVKNLNLWGNDLTDVSILQRMPNVEVLSLSVNKIDSLVEFSHCPKLIELYLRKNAVGDLSELAHLQALRNLRVLWLCDNPCAETGQYRMSVIRVLPNLAKLDNEDISSEEREKAASLPLSAFPDGVRDILSGGYASSHAPPLPVSRPPSAPVSVPSQSIPTRPSSYGRDGPAPVVRESLSAVRESRDSYGGSRDPTPTDVRRSAVQSTSPQDLDQPPRARPTWQAPDRHVVDSIRAASAAHHRVEAPADDSRPSSRPTSVGARGRTPNVLYAMLALLNELSDEDMLLLKKEVDSKLQQSR